MSKLTGWFRRLVAPSPEQSAQIEAMQIEIKHERLEFDRALDELIKARAGLKR